MRNHGGDWRSYTKQYGQLPLDFSANISPLGTPQQVRKAALRALDRIDCYPDPYCRDLCDAIASALHIPPDWCLCGNGAADLLFRIALAVKPNTALIPVPTFSEYEAALQTVDCAVTHYALSERDDFVLSERFVAQITPEIDLVVLCSPNNPTGLTISPERMHRIIERCRETGTLLVVDACFQEFLDDPEAHSLIPPLADNPHLLVVKAFTKLYAIPGLRLGYCLSANPALLERIHDMGQPWAVSVAAQEAGIAALKETEYVQNVRRIVREQREWLYSQLCALGLRVIPGEANYLLFQSRAGLAEALKKHGILIRCCADYAGLDETWYRTAVRTEEENTRLLTALREVIG